MNKGPFRILRGPLSKRRVDLGIALFAAAAAQIIAVPLPLILRTAVHSVTQQQNSLYEWFSSQDSLLMGFAVALALMALMQAIFRWLQEVRGENVAQGVLADLRSQMYEHLQTLPQGFFDRRPAGRVLIRFIGDSNALRAWLGRIVITFPADVITVLGVTAAVTYIHPDFLAAALMPLLMILPAITWINPRSRGWTRKARRGQSRLCMLLNDRLACMGLIKSVGVQSQDRAQARNLIDDIATANVRRARLDAWAKSISVMCATLALSGVGLWGTRLWLMSEINHFDLLAAVWLMLLLRGPIHRISGANVTHQRARVAVERIGQLLQRPSEPGTGVQYVPYSGPGRHVQLHRVSYRKPGRRWVLRRLSAEITGPGLTVVSDHGGDAKSVVLELLLRLRRPHRGRIQLDGQLIKTLRVADLRRVIGWVDNGRRIIEIGALSPALDPNPERLAVARKIWDSTHQISGAISFDDVLRRSERLRAGKSDRKHGGWTRDAQLRVAIFFAILDGPAALLIDDPTVGLKPEVVDSFFSWLREYAATHMVIAASNDSRLAAAAEQVIEIPLVADEPRRKRNSSQLRKKKNRSERAADRASRVETAA
ncbi:MAG: ABC transporter ATP-binding protein/permease [Planctomycetes bacterium]|nr:ABC transporter ATP-binding protein/permease [Planctomycetota bacterium]